MSATPAQTIEPRDLTPTERKRLVSLAEAARLRGVHEDTLRRNEREKLVEVSPRRLAMRLEDALMLPD